VIIPIDAQAAISDLSRFDTIVDARSPSEYAEDRLPGAVNWPSLDDEERANVGFEYTRVSPFRAKKHGAAIVARNVAAHIDRHVVDKPPGWAPLVYCWRGGKRSGALATVLDQIGFRVHVLEGGYQAFRRAVVVELEMLPARFAWRVISGPTGSGKSRLLAAMRKDWRGARDTVLRVDGGMVASDWTMQRLADILDAPVDRPTILETTALGAAWLAGSKAGVWPKTKDFARSWALERRFKPDMDATVRSAKLAGWRDAVRRTLSTSALSPKKGGWSIPGSSI